MQTKRASIERLQSDVQKLKEQRRAVYYHINHPIWCNLMDFFPDELIKICCSYSTHDFCVSCNCLFLTILGCADCLTSNEYMSCILSNVNSFFTKKVAQWSDIIFRSENAQEVWNYLKNCISYGAHLNLDLEAGTYVNESFKIGVEYDVNEPFRFLLLQK